MSLSLEQVTKVVGQETHIHPINLSLSAGSLNVLLGPTLAGKTTLMRLMAGLDQPSSGKVFWQGNDVTGMPVQKRNVAMVYQQFINYPSLSVYENIASPLKLRGLPGREIEQRVQEVAELLKLTPMLKRKPLELSGGQQQRCALARALAKEAELVLLDEPLANLDYKLREELREELPKIFMESGAVFVYATTEPSEALLLGGNTLTLWEGELTQFAPTLEVYRQPKDIKTARVFSDPPMNFISMSKSGDQWHFADQQQELHSDVLRRLPDASYQVGFRPNHLLLQAPKQPALQFNAQVTVMELTGSESFVHIDYHEERWVSLTQGIHGLPVGSHIPLYVQPDHLYVFNTAGKLMAAPKPVAD